MPKKMAILLQTILFAGAVLLRCTGEAPVTISEFPDGNCLGTLKDPNGAPVTQASVYLIPENYVPLSSDSSDHVDSTVSDEYGRFGFNVDKSGSFNLLSKKNGVCALRRSIRVSTAARVTLQDEILTVPGSVSGTVHLQGMEDHRFAFVLVLGTNRYTEPADSTGEFSIEGLAPGSYTLRIVPAGTNFAPVETTITVASETLTELPVIDISEKFNPIVKNFIVNYDSTMMKVALSWSRLDTALISGYTIHLNRPMNLQPVATIGDTCSGINLDIITLPFDTFTYQICAVGNNGKPGPSAVGKSFVKRSAIPLIKTIRYACGKPYLSACDWVFDIDGNIYECSSYFINKADSNGVALSAFHHPDGRTGLIFLVRADESGNIYSVITTPIADRSATHSLVRFDRDLAPAAQIQLGSTSAFDYILTGGGSVLIFTQHIDSNGVATSVDATKFDGGFNKIAETKLADNWVNIPVTADPDSWPTIWFLDQHIDFLQTHFFNDTVFCARYNTNSFYKTPTDVLQSIDNKLSSLISPKVTEFIDISVPVADQILLCDMGSNVLFSPCGILIAKTLTTSDKIPAQISIFDTKHQLLARMPMNNLQDILKLDCRGNLYIIRQSDPSTVTIYKYAIAPLLRQNTP